MKIFVFFFYLSCYKRNFICSILFLLKIYIFYSYFIYSIPIRKQCSCLLLIETRTKGKRFSKLYLSSLSSKPSSFLPKENLFSLFVYVCTCTVLFLGHLFLSTFLSTSVTYLVPGTPCLPWRGLVSTSVSTSCSFSSGGGLYPFSLTYSWSAF